MSAMIKEILGEERWKSLMEFAEKLGREPESMLRDLVDKQLLGVDNING